MKNFFRKVFKDLDDHFVDGVNCLKKGSGVVMFITSIVSWLLILILVLFLSFHYKIEDVTICILLFPGSLIGGAIIGSIVTMISECR